MDTAKTSDPIRGWKQCETEFRMSGDTALLVPIGSPDHPGYGVEARSTCAFGHWLPNLNPELHMEVCSCGFYAWKSGGTVTAAVDECKPLLDVELYGLVIEHEQGYRAEYQRILSISLYRPLWKREEEFRSLFPTDIRILGKGKEKKKGKKK